MSLPEGADLATFLCEACSGNTALEERVAALVNSSKESTQLLPDEPAGWTIGGEVPGKLIGNYRLEKVIGHGAFGVVWLAQQLRPVQRLVAIKILKLGLDTVAVMSRFEAERQALAMMDHSNVANVYDAGATDEGRP
jgi:serine/threonine protein kinase